MKIRIVRTEARKSCTLGELYIDDKFKCYALEDIVRADGVKVYGETAIPMGTYNVVLAPYKNHGLYPMLENVPMFTGIFIHGVHDEKDTLGCIGTGMTKFPDHLLGGPEASRIVREAVTKAIEAGEKVTCTIEAGKA